MMNKKIYLIIKKHNELFLHLLLVIGLIYSIPAYHFLVYQNRSISIPNGAWLCIAAVPIYYYLNCKLKKI